MIIKKYFKIGSLISLTLIFATLYVLNTFALGSPVTILDNAYPTTNLVNGRNIVRDSSGNLYFAYFKLNSSYYHIFVAKSTDNGASWQGLNNGPIENLGSYHQAYPAMAIDSADNLHVVWSGYDSLNPANLQVKHARYNGTTWQITGSNGTIQTISGYDQVVPKIAIDGSNNLHVVWVGKDSSDPTKNHIRYSASPDGSSWTNWDNLDNLPGYDQVNPDIAIDSSNNIHVVWAGQDSQNGSTYQIKHIDISGIGNIGTISGYDQDKPSIAIDSSNNLHVTWLGADPGSNSTGFVKYAKRAGTTWTNWVNINPGQVSTQGYPSIAISPGQNPWIMWDEKYNTDSQDNLYTSFYNGQYWETPIQRGTFQYNHYPIMRWSKFNNNSASTLDFGWLKGNISNPSLVFDNFTLTDSAAAASPGAPATPSIAAITADELASTSIKWNFTMGNSANIDGYRLYNQNNSLLATNTDASKRIILETGLTPNTFYSGRFIRAYNTNGESLSSNPAQGAYTRIETPIDFSFTKTAGSIRVSSTNSLTNLDKGDSGILFFEHLVTQSYSGWSKTNGWSLNNPIPAEPYGFVALTRNSQGLGNSLSLSKTTFALPADALGKAKSIDHNTSKIKIDPNNNSRTYAKYLMIIAKEPRSGTNYDIKFIHKNGTLSEDVEFNTYDEFGGKNGVTINSLEANTKYGFRVKAYNLEGDQTDWSPWEIIYSKPKRPNIKANIRTEKWYKKVDMVFENNLKWDDDLEYYRYYVDTRPTHSWTDNEDKWSQSDLKFVSQISGEYYLHVRSYNRSDEPNESLVTNVNSQGGFDFGPYLVDADPPQIFPLLSPGKDEIISLSTKLKWQQAIDEHSGVDNYELYIDGEQFSQTNNTAYTIDENLISSGWHKWQVKAVDKVGNATFSEEQFFYNDTNKPTVRITKPANNKLVKGRQKFSVYGEDEMALSKIDLFIDSKFMGRLNKSGSIELDTKTLDDRNHVIQAVAYDKANNQASDSIRLQSDNNAPQTTLIVTPSKPDGLDNKYETRPMITLLSNEPSLTFYSLDGNDKILYSSAFFIPDGSHRLNYQSIDLIGNKEELKSRYFKIEKNPFYIELIEPKNNANVSGHVNIKAVLKGIKGKTNSKLEIDGETKKVFSENSLSYTWDTSKEKDGFHTITIKSIDSLLKKTISNEIKVKADNKIVRYAKKLGINMYKAAPLFTLPFLLIFTGSLYLTGQHFIDWRSEKLN